MRLVWIGLLAGLATGCAAGTGYPGRASVPAGAPAVVLIERTGASETDPRVLYVRPGTEVRWQNRTTRPAWVRFSDPIPEVCGEPVRFHRSDGGRSFASDPLGPFEEAALCFLLPGDYAFVVSIQEPAGPRPLSGAVPPAKYGTVVVRP